MFGIKPLGDRVVIKKAEAEEKTVGGLILTSAAKEMPHMAEVVAVGPGTKDEPMELKVGDKVIFSKYGGTDVKYEGEEYTFEIKATARYAVSADFPCLRRANLPESVTEAKYSLALTTIDSFRKE